MASWKKIVTSGSNAELNHITSSGNFEIIGNVSGFFKWILQNQKFLLKIE